MKVNKLVVMGMVAVVSLSTAGLSTYAASTTSDAKVLFESDDNGVTPPVDPTDPGTDVTPTDPVAPTTGALRIDFASQFNFGTQTISGAAKDYHALYSEIQPLDAGGLATGPKKYVPQYVQVTDNRGSNAGWNLTVSGTEFTNASSQTLAGATLTLGGGTLSSAMPNTLTPGTVTPSVTVGAASQVLVSAEANKGMGTWVHSFGSTIGVTAADTNPDVTLHVPAEAQKVAGSTYTSTLTWTINDTP
ncbi:WxL domain-containing protein [Listeria rustica]|uniref:WxL domain-containing protein n=1 Tax=Listeria rustica TaxID=2713503 RepID=A0A7W1T954_9LIST|nr:WxL domain-containing protein [Listeria rustica]MBA3927715.1 WxL domain-containing protein [Listeria rustica]